MKKARLASPLSCEPVTWKEVGMIGYIHTTRECSLGQLPPAMLQAIRDYFQSHRLGDPESEIRICTETIARKRSPGRLSAFLDGNLDEVTHLAILLTAEWLVWVRHGLRSGTNITGAKLGMIQVKVFIAKRTKNMEMGISGLLNDSKEPARGTLTLGPEPAAQKICDEVLLANQKLVPPAKNKFLRWMRN
jgi:hypothetical protein